jgi:peptidyl-prolyl cis-trans isomerase SurA
MKRPGFVARANAAAIAMAAAIALSASGCSSLSSIKMPWSHKASPAAAPAPGVSEAPPPPPEAVDTSATTDHSTPPADEGDTVDRVLATVDGNPITTRDVKTFMAAHPAGSASAGAGGMQPFGGGGTPTDPQDVLQALITETMLDDEAMKFIPKLDEGQVDRYVQNVEERNHLTDEQLRAQLQSQGVSYDAFRSNVRRQVATMTMIDREVRQKIVIPDSEIQAYYKEHPDEFTVSDEHYRLAQILIAVPPGASPEQIAAAQKKADDIHKQAVNGANFGDLARQYSDDDSKNKGGQLGDFTPSDLNDDIAKAIAPLKDGDVSHVVRTKYGFHIVKVEEHERPGLQSLDDVKNIIRDKLMTDQAKAKFQDWIDQDLKRRHLVEMSD